MSNKLFILEKNWDEGSVIVGVFTSLDALLHHIGNMVGIMVDEDGWYFMDYPEDRIIFWVYEATANKELCYRDGFRI